VNCGHPDSCLKAGHVTGPVAAHHKLNAALRHRQGGSSSRDSTYRRQGRAAKAVISLGIQPAFLGSSGPSRQGCSSLRPGDQLSQL